MCVCKCQDTVRAEIAHLKHEKHADQKAAIKRLLVKWHPDRNPAAWAANRMGVRSWRGTLRSRASRSDAFAFESWVNTKACL